MHRKQISFVTLLVLLSLVSCQKSEDYFAKVEQPAVIDPITPPVDDIRIPGCIDKNSPNFSAEANVDDGSCIIPGCTDQNAENYDPKATEKDQSCLFAGCMLPGYKETNLAADVHKDELCKTLLIRGCKNPKYQEYMPNADISDPSLCLTKLYNSRSVNIPITSDLLNDFSATVNLVVDNSPSMEPSQLLLANGFNNFAQYFSGYDLFFNIYSTYENDYQTVQGLSNGALFFLKDPMNKNSLFRKLDRTLSGQPLIDFSNGLKNDLLLGTIQYEKERGLCALTRLAFEENNALLRPPMTTVDNKVQVYMIISDENDYTDFWSCNKQYTVTPTGTGYYNKDIWKRVSFTYTRMVRNEVVVNYEYHDINNQESLDYYNSKSNSDVTCNPADEAILQSKGISEYTSCKVRRSNHGFHIPGLGSIPNLCQGGAFTYNGVQYANIDAYITSNLSFINSFNYQPGGCYYYGNTTVNREFFVDNEGSNLDFAKIFVDKITARHGKTNTLFLPIIYNPNATNCTSQQSQFMEAGNKYIETMNYMKSDRAGAGPGKSAAYDICGNDYAKFLKDNLGDYLKEVFGRLYKIPMVSEEVLNGVFIVEADGTAAALDPSMYSVTRTDVELSLEILPAVSLNKNQTIRVDIKTPQ